MSRVSSAEVLNSCTEVWNLLRFPTSGEVGEFMDRRQHKRFDLNAPGVYRWEEPEGIQGTGHGTTRDVSECGLFLLTDSVPPVGIDIDLEVSFPFRDDSQIQMKAKGKVVRVETGGEASKGQGFAAVTQVVLLRNPAFSSDAGISAR